LIDNLEPLDSLALARRYAELQVQALEQETKAYESATGKNAALAPFIAEYLPLLRQHFDRAHGVLRAAGQQPG
jgi:hypothetical protein